LKEFDLATQAVLAMVVGGGYGGGHGEGGLEGGSASRWNSDGSVRVLSFRRTTPEPYFLARIHRLEATVADLEIRLRKQHERPSCTGSTNHWNIPFKPMVFKFKMNAKLDDQSLLIQNNLPHQISVTRTAMIRLDLTMRTLRHNTALADTHQQRTGVHMIATANSNDD
jgi:hypothetical protein